MGVKKNTITINGRTYDTITGQLVNDAPVKRVPVKTAVVPVASSVAPLPKAKKIHVRDNDTPRTTVKATTVHVRAERPKTLVRSAVKKPSISAKRTTSVTPVLRGDKPTIVHGRNDDREVRAVHIMKSHQITKFSPATPNVTHRTAHIPVRPAPVVANKQNPSAHVSTHSGRTAYNIQDTPPMPQPAHTTKKHHAKQPVNMFEEALRTAESHKKPRVSKKTRLARKQAGALIASFLILALFFTYQNAPRIALRNAQSEIGFQASVPGYTPAGFGRASAIQYRKGMVVLNFRSNSDDRQYVLTQTSTSLDNQSLVTTYLKPQNKQFETSTINGQSVYIYDGSRATWIRHGVWYTIDGNARLSKDQLTNIIASI